MKKITFLTGASWVGKTTLVEWLKERYKQENWAFLHFDSIWVPSLEDMEHNFGSWDNWQRETTWIWIQKMLTEFPHADNIIFEWQVRPQFIEEGFQKYGFDDYQIILVDCDSDTMGKRLAGSRDQPELFTTDMKNWLQYLRAQAQELWISIINTSSLTPEETINALKKELVE